MFLILADPGSPGKGHKMVVVCNIKRSCLVRSFFNPRLSGLGEGLVPVSLGSVPAGTHISHW